MNRRTEKSPRCAGAIAGSWSTRTRDQRAGPSTPDEENDGRHDELDHRRQGDRTRQADPRQRPEQRQQDTEHRAPGVESVENPGARAGGLRSRGQGLAERRKRPAHAEGRRDQHRPCEQELGPQEETGGRCLERAGEGGVDAVEALQQREREQRSHTGPRLRAGRR